MNDDATVEDASPVAVVGAGAVGTALARRLVACGYPVHAILSQTPASANSLAEQVGASVASGEWEALPDAVRLVMVCVPDDAIPSVAEELAAVPHPWTRTLVGHTSGARTAEALAPLAHEGAATFSFHPLQTFTADTPPEAFVDAVVGVEGADEAVSAGTALARALGARPIPLTARGKTLYHCAAVLASNGLVALMGVVEEVLSTSDLDNTEGSAPELVGPLVQQTWQNLTTAPPESALTGPIARGDAATIEAHLDALRNEAPHLLPLYAALSTEMTRLAIRGGQLDAETAESMLGLLQDALQSADDGGAPFDSLN
jgi:predicted short-subunit dehydrogenase-like oxidoreductase (DUF2520 family)